MFIEPPCRRSVTKPLWAAALMTGWMASYIVKALTACTVLLYN